MAHSKYSPSSSSRYLRCAGSVTLCEMLGEEESVPRHTAEGSAAHELAELVLRGEKDPIAYEGRVLSHDGYDFEVDDDMIDYVGAYVDEIRRRAADADIVEIEHTVDLSNVMQFPDQSGTADAIIVKGNRVEVHDLKYGKGVQVDAEENTQLMIYALGAIEEFGLLADIEECEVFIHQPRLDHFDSWEFPADRWGKFAAEVQAAIKEAESDNPSFNAGAVQCRWCKAKAMCKVAAKQVSDAIGADFDVLDENTSVPAIADCFAVLTVEDLEVAYNHLEFIQNWVKAIRESVMSKAMEGETKRFKPVAGKRGARAWEDSTKAEDIMKSMRLKQDDMYSRKLISPTQAEKLLKKSPKRWNRLTDLITQPDGNPVLVPMSDPKPSIAISDDEFEDVSDTDNDDLI